MKKVLHIVFYLLALPLLLIFWLFQPVLGKDRSFQFCSQLISLPPGTPGNYLRAAFYAMLLPRCDVESSIGFGVIFSHADTELGKRVYIGPQSNIGLCVLEDEAILGSGVHILSGRGQHNFDNPNVRIQDQGGKYEKITIGQDSWIGNNATVMADIGQKCVVGAGSVVTKPVNDFSIVAGNPARLIAQRKDSVA